MLTISKSVSGRATRARLSWPKTSVPPNGLITRMRTSYVSPFQSAWSFYQAIDVACPLAGDQASHDILPNVLRVAISRVAPTAAAGRDGQQSIPSFQERRHFACQL